MRRSRAASCGTRSHALSSPGTPRARCAHFSDTPKSTPHAEPRTEVSQTGCQAAVASGRAGRHYMHHSCIPARRRCRRHRQPCLQTPLRRHQQVLALLRQHQAVPIHLRQCTADMAQGRVGGLAQRLTAAASVLGRREGTVTIVILPPEWPRNEMIVSLHALYISHRASYGVTTNQYTNSSMLTSMQYLVCRACY